MTPSSVHALDVRLVALKRLLDRCDEEGALVRADRALVEMAIAAARRDLDGVRALLATIPGDPPDAHRAAADVMAAAVIELDQLLDGLGNSTPSDG